MFEEYPKKLKNQLTHRRKATGFHIFENRKHPKGGRTMSDYGDYRDYTGSSVPKGKIKRRKNKNKPVLRVLIFLISVFLIYLLVRFGIGLFQLASMKSDINDLTQQTMEMRTTLDDLNLKIEQLQSDSYIEEKAREMGMIKKGENQVVTEPDKSQATSSTVEITDKNESNDEKASSENTEE